MGNDVATIYRELTPAKLSLDMLYLDPNNPRFTSLDWADIPESQIAEENIQRRVQDKLEEEFSIDRLIMNIEVNGFLTIDRIIVREYEENKYVALEGNRRLCAAKILKQRYDADPGSVDESVIESLKEIDCLVYTGAEDQPAWIFQGLRHIMGVQDWSAFNKAKLLVQLMENENLSLTDVGKRFGLTAFGAGQWVRGYYAFKQASEESDYTREIDERAYPYFQEIFSRSNTTFREWLQWDDSNYRFGEELHFNEFLSWLYPRSEEERLDGTDIRGDWSQKKLSKRDDIRTISFLIRESPIDFETFRNDGDLDKAYNLANTKKILSQSDPAEEAFINITACLKSLENLPFKIIMTEKDKLIALLLKLEKAMKDIESACQ